MGNDELLVLRQLTIAINRLNENIEAQNAPKAEYVLADEAATLVGLNITPSKGYRNKLTKAFKMGLMPNSIHGRPYRFHVSDCKELAQKRAEGLVL